MPYNVRLLFHRIDARARVERGLQTGRVGSGAPGRVGFGAPPRQASLGDLLHHQMAPNLVLAPCCDLPSCDAWSNAGKSPVSV